MSRFTTAIQIALPWSRLLPLNSVFHITTVIPIVLLAVFSVKKYIKQRSDNPAGLPFPPGPPRLPIIGNLLGIKDLGKQWLTYAEWSKKYGDLLYLEILGQKVLVINSEKVAVDLLDKRSQNYSDRPPVPMVALMGWDFNVGLMPYNPSSRKHRKVMHQALNRTAMINYQHIQLDKVRQLVKNVSQAPEDMVAHFHTFTASMIMTVVYGYKMAPRDDLFASIAARASEMLANSFFPGAALVNAFPALQHLPEWFPGAGFKRYARICRKLTRDLRDLPFDFVRKQVTEGIAPHSMVSEMIENNEEEDVIKSIAGTTYASAVETSSAALSAFLLAVLVFPDAQRKAQAEIDRITGGTRLPNFSDRPSMVYLEATYREVLRWSQVAPLGVPHFTTGDDVYEGYFIPKGTVVLPNVWWMTHNESKYPDPMRFMPERFIDAEGRLIDDLGEQQFGFGRRICVGKYLAEASVWIAMVSVLAVFNVNKARDEHGHEVDVVPQFTPGILTQPMPFPFSITPRSPRAAQLIQQIEADD